MIGIELAEKRSKIDNDTKAKQYKFFYRAVSKATRFLSSAEIMEICFI